MKIIKKINNNFAMAEDDLGRTLIAFGKGIGFPQMPYELNDLSKIDRTFYDAKEEHITMFRNADEKVIALSIELLDYIRSKLNKDISDYLYYVLVDHINFAVERFRKGVYVPMNLSNEIRFNYQDEYDVAKQCREIINKRMNIALPKDEASIIAMHIVESQTASVRSEREIDINALVADSMQILENQMQTELDESDFNVYRFITHLKYLIQRLQSGSINSQNEDMYEVMKEKYPETYELSEKVCSYLGKQLNAKITDEEKLYLMLHINRLAEKSEN